MKKITKHCKVKDLVGKMFSHNEIISLWVNITPESDERIWRGEAWRIPEEYKNVVVKRIFSVIPETIWEAGTINILLADKAKCKSGR